MLSDQAAANCHCCFTDFTRTVEANRRLCEYDAVAFSVSFEGDYPSIVRLLREGGVPPRAPDRSDNDPLVLIGGVAPTMNPEPLSPIADIIFLGEAEAGFVELQRFLSSHGKLRRERLLRELAESCLPGVYVPSAYEVIEEDCRVVERRPLGGAPKVISRQWAKNPWPPARTEILTEGGPFNGAYLLEISRGCPHGCRFCAAGYSTRPARFLSVDVLIPLIEKGLKKQRRIGLVGAAVSDHPDFESICKFILSKGGQFAVSSLRAETLSADKLDLLKAGGIKTITVAMEAGSEALRRRLGKGITEADLLEAARLAVGAGISNLRIYAMVGLPGETDKDVEALYELCLAARKTMGKGQVSLSVAPFVPKPHTPLQWSATAPEAVLKKRIQMLKKLFGGEKGLNISAEPPRQARLQSVFSRGGRWAAEIIDPKNNASIAAALKASGAAKAIEREIAVEEKLPWDFIAGTPNKKSLLKEKSFFETGEKPLQCTPGACRICGICP